MASFTTKKDRPRPIETSAIEVGERVLERLTELVNTEDYEARAALEREPGLVQAVAIAEDERDAALMQVAAHEGLAIKHLKHLEMIRAELTKTKAELQKAHTTLKEIGAKIGRGT